MDAPGGVYSLNHTRISLMAAAGIGGWGQDFPLLVVLVCSCDDDSDPVLPDDVDDDDNRGRFSAGLLLRIIESLTTGGRTGRMVCMPMMVPFGGGSLSTKHHLKFCEIMNVVFLAAPSQLVKMLFSWIKVYIPVLAELRFVLRGSVMQEPVLPLNETGMCCCCCCMVLLDLGSVIIPTPTMLPPPPRPTPTPPPPPPVLYADASLRLKFCVVFMGMATCSPFDL